MVLVMDAAGVKSLSTMPNREGLLSMLAGSLNGIVGGLAVALQGIVDKQDETAALILVKQVERTGAALFEYKPRRLKL